jgi:hypothetical protein
MKRTIIAVIVFALALVAVPTVVALAQQPDSTAACPYNGEGGIDHLAMHNQMSGMMGQMNMGQMSGMMGQMDTGQMGRMDMGQMSGMMGQMDTGRMDGMRPDVAR